MKDFAREARLRELLADRALLGLSSDGQRELDALGAEESADRISYETAAAAAHLAFVGDQLEPFPADLRARLSSMLTQE